MLREHCTYPRENLDWRDEILQKLEKEGWGKGERISGPKQSPIVPHFWVSHHLRLPDADTQGKSSGLWRARRDINISHKGILKNNVLLCSVPLSAAMALMFTCYRAPRSPTYHVYLYDSGRVPTDMKKACAAQQKDSPPQST